MYGSPQKDLNLPIPSSPYGHRKDEPDLMLQHQQQHGRAGQINSGLLRYRSAPSNLLGEMCEDFLPVHGRTSSPETDSMLARFLGTDLRDPIRDHKPAAPPPATSAPHFTAPVPVEENHHPHQMLYHSHQQQMPSHSSVESLYRTVSSSAGMETEQMKAAGGGAGGGGANLVRQSSSPAGLFSHLNVENGYNMMRGVSGTNNRLKSQLSFSSRQGSLMSQISEMGSEGVDGSSPEGAGAGSAAAAVGGGGRCYIPGFSMNSWEDSSLLSDSFSGMKRQRETESKIISGLNTTDTQSGLAHQFSLPKTSSEMAAIEKFLQFQDAVPCKIRAKRGCATHPRSIAERVRRTRISERIRKLQELVPNMDKQTNTADMLDLAVDYIKDLQKQVKTLTESRANCTCSSSKQKQYTNPAA